MVTHWYDDDEVLLAELGQALLAEPVPGVEAAAKALFTWRTIDDDLAALAYDSAVADEVDVRGGEPPDSAVLRTLTFTTTTMTIEIGVRQDGVIGQIVPPQPGTVEIRTEVGAFGTAEIDDLGCFTVAATPRAPFRLHLETAGGRAITPWVHV
jgi:hypothetical protein